MQEPPAAALTIVFPVPCDQSAKALAEAALVAVSAAPVPVPQDFDDMDLDGTPSGSAEIALSPPVHPETGPPQTASLVEVSAPLGARKGSPSAEPEATQKLATLEAASVNAQKELVTDLSLSKDLESVMAPINFIHANHTGNALRDYVWEVDGAEFRCSPVVYAAGSEDHLNVSSRDWKESVRIKFHAVRCLEAMTP